MTAKAREACLVDVYDTLLSCDFVAHRAELPLLAGLSMQAWGEGYRQIGRAFGVGQLTKAEGFERILRDAGVEPRPDLVRALVNKDREVLLRSARLYEDAPGATVARSLTEVAAMLRGSAGADQGVEQVG